ncbi:ActS/PrrB/RegB family redox-sensitive histidine kinase [Labrys monachus]|uniref:histidine kinase n=1 Tax=Labrys monachus TaxID=217067 RepID=A0ABU0FCF0_9HYPH|nr:ActS/PrrB/RegB family redox-sensitive histidine kinase [Labrys monachus]MDQ0392275.1 two-component system sensor histidine kinase RegB [Labrys monachus]
MSSSFLPHDSFGIGTLRLDTLIRLRWMALAGQLSAVLGVHFGLRFSVPLGACLALIGASALVNLVLRLRYPATERVDTARAASFLSFDIIQLAALLFLTGGLENPFAFLFLAPVMISATSLPPMLTLALGLLAIACATVLTEWHLPLPWFDGQRLNMPILYVAGMWFSVLLGLGFIGIYAWRVADEARLLSNALAATELVLAREQHLSQLDGLAAAAAHELGTPLATIALVAKELEVAAPQQGDFIDDIRLLRSQVERCREILGKLASLSEDSAAPFDRLSLPLLIEEVAAPHRDFGIAIATRFEGVERIAPTAARNAGMLYGLGNIVENAVDFAKSQVTIVAAWDPKIVTLTVSDDGPGFPSEIMARLGDPYVTRRRPRPPGQPGGGLGLGFFIAKTLLERSGASISLANRAAPESGAIIRLEWARDIFER